MRIASICAASALVLGFIHGPALAQSPPPTPQPTISEREEVRNTYIFRFDDSVPRGQMAARARQAVAGTGGRLRHVYTEVLGGFAATLPNTAVWNVARRPGIVSFEQDRIATIFAPSWCSDGSNPNHPACKDDEEPVEEDPVEEDPDVEDPPAEELACGTSYSDQKPWGIGRINAPVSHDSTNNTCGQEVHVYVLDTGIDLDHPDLTPVDGVDCTSGCVPGGDDKNGHGTHVAGTIAARINGSQVVGVAPAVHLHAVQVLSPSGRGSYSDIIGGINYVAGKAKDLGVPVVANLSLGGTGTKSETCSSTSKVVDDAFHKAFCDAAHAGVVIVVAAGNSGADAANFVPAAYEDAVITVSATSNADEWPTWSNWGDHEFSNNLPGNQSAPVAIAAPGASILSTAKGGGTTTMSGTSMASPHVAGVAALLLQAGTYVPDQDTTVTHKYKAFLDIRAAMLDDAESTDGTFSNSSGDNPHDEDFVCAANCSTE